MNAVNMLPTLSEQVIDAIRSVVGSASVALHEPSFKGNEWVYLKECLDSTFVSSVGKFVDRFENDLAKFTGAKHAVASCKLTAFLRLVGLSSRAVLSSFMWCLLWLVGCVNVSVELIRLGCQGRMLQPLLMVQC